MDIWIMDVNKFVKVNNLKPITSSLFFNSDGTPDENGLFSYSIFGSPGSLERKQRFAYIPLDNLYLNPHIYKVLIQLDRHVSEIIDGTNYYVIDPKVRYFRLATDADEHDPTLGTGIEFLYKYWDDIKFRDSEAGSKKRSDRLELLYKLNKDAIFMDKQVVIPAFLRDMSFDNMSSDELNTFYKKLITSVQMIKQLGKSSFSYNITKSKIQNTLFDIYCYFTGGYQKSPNEKTNGLLAKKRGFVHSAVLSKNIDYGIRTLITAPSFDVNTWKELPGTYTKASVPLMQCMSLFTLAVQAWVLAFVEAKVMDRTNLMVYDPETNQVIRKDLHPKWKDDFLPDAILARINLYIQSPESRFQPIEIHFFDGYSAFAFISGDRDLILENGTVNTSKFKTIRYYTWTDVFYMACEDICSDKHVLITRYPVTGYHSEYFAGINVRTTQKTTEMLIGGTKYDRYPIIDLSTPSSKIESLFIEALEIFNPYLGPLGGDHDGDQVTVRALYSYEANKFAEDYINSLGNLIGVDGNTVREPGDIATHTMYNLLRDPD